MSRTFAALLTAAIVLMLGANAASAECRPAAVAIPQHIMALQLLHGEDPNGWATVAALRPDWIRLEIHWNLTEPEDGKLEWRLVDQALAHAEKSSAKIMLLINNMPDWVINHSAPEAVFRRFLTALMQHTQGKITQVAAIEIFNEPNNPGFGWLRTNREPERNHDIDEKASVALFAKFLHVANEVLRANNSNMLIVSGGLFSQANAVPYLTALLKQDIKGCIDIVGYHPYASIQGLAEQQRQLEALAGIPVWFTEFGSTDNDARAGLLESVFSQIGTINAFFWFLDRDVGIFNEPWGLVDYFNNPKPDFEIFRKAQAARR